MLVLPLRSLVEQTRQFVLDWLGRLGLTEPDGNGEVTVATLLGGERGNERWRTELHRDTVLIGTQDMVLSRALNRGYAANRFLWPVEFGLLNNDCHYVFDEVQLMGAALPTSRQLHAFRASLGATGPVGSTWMSATLDRGRLATVDAPDVPEPFVLSDGDRTDELTRRLHAQRTFHRWLRSPGEPRKLARERGAAILAGHRAGSRTLAVVNTVRSARELHAELVKAKPEADLVLLHSRFRPPDRQRQLERCLRPPGPSGTIVVATQVIEAGVDLSAEVLFTEVAPWSSIVQRCGRVNRDGRVLRATVFWDRPANEAPYDLTDIDAAGAELLALEGLTLTTEELAHRDVAESAEPLSQVLRRTDLLQMFDTTPDLGGNDLDVAPFVRDLDDVDAQLCWRDLGAKATALDEQDPPGRDELCPVPLGELRAWHKTGGHRVYVLDHLGRRRGRWLPAQVADLRPGRVLLADLTAGGYDALTGWMPASNRRVTTSREDEVHDLAPLDEQAGDDPASYSRRWITLSQHLGDVEAEASSLLHALEDLQIPEVQQQAVVAAGRWHDLGKAHEVFQDTMCRTLGEDDRNPGPGTWAKSGGSVRAHHRRRYFRHELASALALLGDASGVLDDVVEQGLAVYLVGAHHGRVRMTIRSLPDEGVPEPTREGRDRRVALGVWDGDILPAVTVGTAETPVVTLDLSPMDLGTEAGDSRSWTEMALTLRDR